MDVSDVVIVGGGIAGSALAYALASAGRTVTVLEASVEYEDRVRGESMMPWGVQETYAEDGGNRMARRAFLGAKMEILDRNQNRLRACQGRPSGERGTRMPATEPALEG